MRTQLTLNRPPILIVTCCILVWSTTAGSAFFSLPRPPQYGGSCEYVEWDDLCAWILPFPGTSYSTCREIVPRHLDAFAHAFDKHPLRRTCSYTRLLCKQRRSDPFHEHESRVLCWSLRLRNTDHTWVGLDALVAHEPRAHGSLCRCRGKIWWSI